MASRLTQDGLQPGREFDAEVATKLFGLKPFEIDGYWQYIPSGKPRRTHMIDAVPLPAFSTDIRAAWQTVERLAQMDPPRWLEIGRREHGWTVSVWTHCQAHGDRCEALDRPVWIDDQETAPLAICRAALKAVSSQL